MHPSTNPQPTPSPFSDDPATFQRQARTLRESVEAIFALPPSQYWPEIAEGDAVPTDAELVALARAQGWRPASEQA